MIFQVTVRFGQRSQRYHVFSVEAPDARAALARAASLIPPEIVQEVDLVELRVAVDPEGRSYLGEEGG
jgi:hypothetical protein